MSQIQLGSMFIGSPKPIDVSDVLKKGGGNNLFVLDGKSDTFLAHINKKFVFFNEHEQDLPSTIELFKFRALGDQKYAEHLGKRNKILVPGEDGELLEFRIFESKKYRDRQGLKVEVHAIASYFDLKKTKVFDPQKTDTLTAEQHVQIALAGTGYKVGNIDFKGTRSFTFDEPFNPFDYLRRISREFELELKFYVTTDGQKITGRYVDMVDQIGEWRGRTVEFGQDLINIERKETTDIVTALFVYGPIQEDGTRLKVFVEDLEARERWGPNGEHLVDHYTPLTEDLDITEERLIQLGEMELAKRVNEVVTYEADIIDLENVAGMENKKIRFGDTIRIKDKYFNPPLYLEARVFNQRRDVFNHSSKIIKLGDYREFTEDEVKAFFKQLQNEIRKRLEKLISVTIISSEGTVFKNGEGSTGLTAEVIRNGELIDLEGNEFDYFWVVGNEARMGKTIYLSAHRLSDTETIRLALFRKGEAPNPVALSNYEMPKPLAMAEITLMKIYDGEEGPEGPPGTDGADGQDGRSIDNVIIEYYKSDSDTTQIGGNWTETKPIFEQGKYLWTRTKIIYKNPSGTDYTTPVLDDSWNALMPDTNYNGLEWSPADGLIVERDDGKVRAVISGTDGLKIQQKVGNDWVDVFYTDIDGNAKFSGSVSLAKRGTVDGFNYLQYINITPEGFVVNYNDETMGTIFRTSKLELGVLRTGFEEFDNATNSWVFTEQARYDGNSVVAEEYFSFILDEEEAFVFSSYESFRHKNLRMGNVSLTGLNGSTAQMQVRNADNTEYAPIAASEFIQASSEKWKTNITKYEGNALDLINQSVLYEYDKEGVVGREIGLIIERETPSEVISGEGTKIYDPLAWKAIQELTAKIEQLEQRIEELEGKAD